MIAVNLDTLNKSTATLTRRQREQVDDFLVGWFAALHDPSEWERAVEAAVSSAKQGILP